MSERMHRLPHMLAVAAGSVFVTSVTALAMSVPQGNPQTGDSGVTPVGSSTFVTFVAGAVELLAALVGTVAVGTAIWKGFQLMAAGDSHAHADAVRGLWRWVLGALFAFGAAWAVGLVRGLLPAGA